MKNNPKMIFKIANIWKDRVCKVGKKGAIVIIDSPEKDINDLTIELIPYLVIEKNYNSIHVYSSRKDVVLRIKECNWEFADGFLCDTDALMDFNIIQSAFGFFDRVYSNVYEGLDDDNPFLLEGVNGLEKKEIIARVFLELREYPPSKKVSIVTSREKEERAAEEYHNFLPLEKYRFPNTKDYFDYCINKYEQKNILNDTNRIVVYGDCFFAREFINAIKGQHKYYLVDRNRNKQGRILNGSMIYSPEEVLIPYCSDVYIFVMIYRYPEVCDYLKKLGYRLGEQVFLLNYKDDISDFDEEYLRERIEIRLSAGAEAYDELRSKYYEEEILLSPFFASGDIYLAGLYLGEYIRKNGINRYIVVVTSKAAQEIADMFGYRTELISREAAFSIIDYSRLIGFDKLKVHNINVCVGNQRIRHLFGRVDINTMHQLLTFRDEKRRRIPNMRQDNSDGIFIYNRIAKKKTVLIAPYSNTEGNLPKEFCDTLIKHLMNKNYDVCTNIGPGEEALTGTIGLHIPYSQILDFVNKCVCFISVRSGLCDIVSSTTSPMVVFYQSQDRVVYDLAEMGLKTDNILQYNMDEMDNEQVINAIEELIDKE